MSQRMDALEQSDTADWVKIVEAKARLNQKNKPISIYQLRIETGFGTGKITRILNADIPRKRSAGLDGLH